VCNRSRFWHRPASLTWRTITELAQDINRLIRNDNVNPRSETVSGPFSLPTTSMCSSPWATPSSAPSPCSNPGSPTTKPITPKLPARNPRADARQRLPSHHAVRRSPLDPPPRRSPPKYATIRQNATWTAEMRTASIRQRLRPQFGSAHLVSPKLLPDLFHTYVEIPRQIRRAAFFRFDGGLHLNAQAVAFGEGPRSE